MLSELRNGGCGEDREAAFEVSELKARITAVGAALDKNALIAD
jgi:hypothetical protein